MTIFRGFDEAVVVDIETTGLDPENDRVVSVAMVRMRFADLKKNLSGPSNETIDIVVNPQCQIPYEASRIHGITNRDVTDKPTFTDVAQQLRDFIGNCPIIAHNVSFDKKFLNAEFERAGVKTLAHNKSFCTMWRFRDFNHGQYKGSDLDNVAQVMGVKRRTNTKHNAVEDVSITFEVAILFYRMDNHLQIPAGKPKPPPLPRSRKYNSE